MGMYTELILGAQLYKDTPDEVINTLKYMIGDIELRPQNCLWPEDKRNPLNGGSYYFAVNIGVSKMWFDEIDKSWRISSRANIKNYEKEIEEFIQWLKPYIEGGSGYRELFAMQIYEESEIPTFYYVDE